MGGGVLLGDPYDSYVYRSHPTRESWMPGYNLAAPNLGRRRSSGPGYYYGSQDGSSHPSYEVGDPLMMRGANLARDRQRQDYQGDQFRKERQQNGSTRGHAYFGPAPLDDTGSLRHLKSTATQPSGRSSSKPSVISIPVVHVNDLNDSPGIAVMPKFKVMSKEEASTLIQSRFRGFTVRRTQPLSHLRTIAKVRSQLMELRNLTSDADVIELAKANSQSRLQLTEPIMSLLFQLDAIQGAHFVVREFRKSVTKEVILLQEEIDALLSGKTNGVDISESLDNLDQPTACPVDVEESDDKHEGEMEDEANQGEGIKPPEEWFLSLENSEQLICKAQEETVQRSEVDDVGDEIDTVAEKDFMPKLNADNNSCEESVGAEVEEACSLNSRFEGTEPNAGEVTSRLSSNCVDERVTLMLDEFSPESVDAVDEGFRQSSSRRQTEVVNGQAERSSVGNEFLNSHGSSRFATLAERFCGSNRPDTRVEEGESSTKTLDEVSNDGGSNPPSKSSANTAQPDSMSPFKSDVHLVGTSPLRTENDNFGKIVAAENVLGAENSDDRALVLKLREENQTLKSMLADIMSRYQIQTTVMNDMRNRVGKIESKLSSRSRSRTLGPIEVNRNSRLRLSPILLHNVSHRLNKLESQILRRRFKKTEKHRQRKITERRQAEWTGTYAM